MLKSLNELDKMRDFLHSNKVMATDIEIASLLTLCKEQGIEAYTQDDAKIIHKGKKYDSETEDTIKDFVLKLWDFSDNKVEDLEELYYDRDDNFNKDDWRKYVDMRNNISKIFSRYVDRNKEYQYILTIEDRSGFSLEYFRNLEVYESEIEVREEMLSWVEEVFQYDDVETNLEYDLSSEFEREMLKANVLEEDDIRLFSDKLSVILNLDVRKAREEIKEDSNKDKMEFYVVTENFIEYECYNKDNVVKHFRSKEEAKREWEEIVKARKIDFLGYEEDESDEDEDNVEMHEYEEENKGHFSLEIDGVCDIECSYEKVVL